MQLVVINIILNIGENLRTAIIFLEIRIFRDHLASTWMPRVT